MFSHCLRCSWASGSLVLLCVAALLSVSSAANATDRSLEEADARAPTENGPPNMLFIMTDQQHAGMMSCAGNPYLKTPAMDSLARDGIRFTNTYAANPVCVPSRIAMATGVLPGRLGVFNNGMKADVPHDVDMRNDPGEMKNVATLPEYKDALLEHRRYLDRWIEESGDTQARAFAVEAARN